MALHGCYVYINHRKWRYIGNGRGDKRGPPEWAVGLFKLSCVEPLALSRFPKTLKPANTKQDE
eukprot:4061065-Pyramimonas_sp.AAC.1